MPYSVKILLDSVNTSGNRLTTWELTYPRFIHSELMTHRVMSRNAASSRAIPIAKIIERVKNDPAMFVWYGKNQPGMQAAEEMDGKNKELFVQEWLNIRDLAIESAEKMIELGAHKQMVNRILEPWSYITVILTGTDFDGFFRQRNHKDAQPELAYIAKEMQKQYQENTPKKLDEGQWHLPLVLPWEELYYPLVLKEISAGRCARVSYLTHDGKRDVKADVDLHDKLVSSGHWSPFEHVAMACDSNVKSGNFAGWKQYRSEVDPYFKR